MLPWLFICTDTATSRGIGQDQPDRGVSDGVPLHTRGGPTCMHELLQV